MALCFKEKMKIVIKTSRKYGSWFAKHIKKEHPKAGKKLRIVK